MPSNLAIRLFDPTHRLTKTDANGRARVYVCVGECVRACVRACGGVGVVGGVTSTCFFFFC